MKQVSFQVQKADQAFMDKISAIPEIECERLETSSFDGQSEIITLLITVTPLIIAQLGKIVSEQLKAKKHVKIVYKGTQIQGVSEDTATEILEKIIKAERSK